MPTPTSSSKEELVALLANELAVWRATEKTHFNAVQMKVLVDNLTLQLESLLTSQKETMLDELLSEMPEQAWYVHGTSTKDKLRNQYNAGFNLGLERVKAIIEKRKEV